MTTTDTAGMPWRAAPIVALDLEGTGAQDRDDEAILEIALVSPASEDVHVAGVSVTDGVVVV